GEACEKLRHLLDSGLALKKLKELVAAQGGNPQAIDRPELLPQARRIVPVAADRDGYVTAIDAQEIGLAAMRLGAGRATRDAKIDLSVGVVLRCKVGDAVHAGESIADLYVNDISR